MSSSRLIRGEGAALACVAWQAPEVPQPGGRGTYRRSSDVDEAAIQQRAWQQGFDQGRAAGMEAGLRELAPRVEAVERILDALARPLEDLDHRVETELLTLVQTLVRALVRREMHIDPTHVIGILREGLAALPLSAENVVVRLHPDDAESVRQCLTPRDQDRAWRIETDPLLERGGCLIGSDRSTIDGCLDTRLARVMATLLEDERAGTR